MKRSYEVGHGKPPIKTRFKPGQSGNPRGRPTRKPDLTTRIGKKLASKRSVVISGTRVELPIEDILLERLIERAAKGDVKVLLFLLDEAQKYRDGQENAKASKWRIYSQQEIAEMTEQEQVDLYMNTLKRIS
jgi:hypothetical protein